MPRLNLFRSRQCNCFRSCICLCCKYPPFRGDGPWDFECCPKQATANPGVTVSHTRPRGWVTAPPLLHYSLPRSGGGDPLSHSNYACPENREARYCQSVVFKYYESAPPPKSCGWLKKSHSFKNIKFVGIFLIHFLIVIFSWFKSVLFSPTSSLFCSPAKWKARFSRLDSISCFRKDTW